MSDLRGLAVTGCWDRLEGRLFGFLEERTLVDLVTCWWPADGVLFGFPIRRGRRLLLRRLLSQKTLSSLSLCSLVSGDQTSLSTCVSLHFVRATTLIVFERGTHAVSGSDEA